MKKMDYVFAGIVIVTALLLWGYAYCTAGKGAYVDIFVGEECVCRYALTQDGEYNVYTDGGGYNKIVIQGGKVYVSEADCPDGLCVKQHPISHSGEVIVCLPHKLSVRVQGTKDASLDAITN